MPIKTFSQERVNRMSPGVRRHLQTLLVGAVAFGPQGAAFIERMRVCRKGRPCNIHSCPDCRSHQSALWINGTLDAFADTLKENIRTVDILFPPRPRLYDSDADPRADMRSFKKYLRNTLRSHDIQRAVIRGCFELELKPPMLTRYLRFFPELAEYPEIVIPHVHLMTVMKDADGYLDASRTRKLFISRYGLDYQTRCSSLFVNQSKEFAIEKRMGYQFKRFTAGITGDHLEDYIRMQMEIRKDALVVDYRIGD